MPSGSQAIATTTVAYPAHRTVEEGKALRGDMAGQFTKNLLLRDKKGTLYLLVAAEDRPIDLKTLHKRIGALGRLGFAAPDLMLQVLGCQPGSLTPFALINDSAGKVQVVLDARMMEADQLNFHPLVNTRSTGISPHDLVRFVESCGRKPALVDVEAIEAPD
jgi:Ala-tRNA(Pro) deacylase